ncbi:MULTISPECIES: ABC transporter substrate-binding protein [Agrobacterium]|uniref:ABC transporter substrate-binding protein n=1 Tax=Agrobacterium TaxID=357 RepID=UPI003BA18988
MLKKTWLASVSAAIFALGTVPCLAQQGAACGSGERVTVNLLWPTQPVSLDGNYDTLVLFSQINRNLYDGLFKLDNSMKIEPDLATGFKQLDEKTYDIALRSGVVFHDGSPFNSADVVSTFNRIATDQKLASKQRSYVSNVESVTAVDDHTVRFKLKQQDASFIGVLASIIYITPKSVIDKIGNVDFGKNPVGTGPFKFETWNQGDSVVLKANCDYWGEKPIPSEVEFRFIAEPATQISSLLSGEIDIATEVTPDLAAGLRSSSEVSVKSVNGNKAVFLSLNTLEGPLTDKRVRQALNYAVDKAAITKSLFDGRATPVGQIYAPSVFGYTKSIAPYPYDPERAKKLLQEAGFTAEKPLTLELVNYIAELNPVWQSIAAYFGKVGINIKTKFDPNFFGDSWLQKKMAPQQMFISQNNNLLMDADFVLGLTLHGPRRGIYFHGPETDAEIASARGEPDVGKRQAAYDKLNTLLYDLAPVVFLYSTDATFGVNTAIDWKPRPDGAIYLAGVTKK